MDTLTAFNDFLKCWVNPKEEELGKKISTYILDNKSELVGGLVDSFKEVCRKACAQQENNGADSIKYISYSLLYINFIDRKPLYLIEAFNDKWFFSDSISEHIYEPEWMTSPLYEFYSDAVSECRKYLGQIHPIMVEKMILTVLDKQAGCLMRFAKEAFGSIDLEEIEEFKKLKKNNFMITIGKFRGSYKEIYKRE
jgi:hypothetical protein